MSCRDLFVNVGAGTVEAEALVQIVILLMPHDMAQLSSTSKEMKIAIDWRARMLLDALHKKYFRDCEMPSAEQSCYPALSRISRPRAVVIGVAMNPLCEKERITRPFAVCMVEEADGSVGWELMPLPRQVGRCNEGKWSWGGASMMTQNGLLFVHSTNLWSYDVVADKWTDLFECDLDEFIDYDDEYYDGPEESDIHPEGGAKLCSLGGNLYAVAGYMRDRYGPTSADSVWEWADGEDNWQRAPGKMGRLGEPRSGHRAVTHNGEILVITGMHWEGAGGNYPHHGVNSFEVWDGSSWIHRETSGLRPNEDYCKVTGLYSINGSLYCVYRVDENARLYQGPFRNGQTAQEWNIFLDSAEVFSSIYKLDVDGKSWQKVGGIFGDCTALEEPRLESSFTLGSKIYYFTDRGLWESFDVETNRRNLDDI